MTDTSPSGSPSPHTGTDNFTNSPTQPVIDWRTLYAGNSTGTLFERMGMELLELSSDRAVGRIPVQGNTQPAGLLHGGASVVLAETLGSLAAQAYAGPNKKTVGIEVNATHHRGVREGYVTGTATAIHLGRTMASYEIALVNDEGKRVCTARLNCMILN